MADTPIGGGHVLGEIMRRSFQGGELLFAEGAPAENLYIIESGSVRLFKKVFREQIAVETRGPRDIIGELVVLDGATYQLSAVADDEVVALVVPRESLASTLAADASLTAAFQRQLAMRLAQSQHQLSVLALRSPMGRLLAQLRHEASRQGVEPGSFVNLPLDLHELCGLEAKTVRRLLSALRDEGELDFDDAGGFRFTDMAAVERRLAFLELSDRFEG